MLAKNTTAKPRRSPPVPRWMWFALGLVGITLVTLIAAISWLLVRWFAPDNNVIVPPVPTASATFTPIPHQPQVAASPRAVTAGLPVAVFGSGWTPNDRVTIFLRDPQHPSDPIQPVGTGVIAQDGTLLITFDYPTDVRWAELTGVDIVVQSSTTGGYTTTSVGVELPAATVTPTATLTPTPTATPVPSTSTPVPPTATPTRIPPTATPLVITDWRGEYFAGTQLLGAPLVRNDVDVNFSWGRAAPWQGLPDDNFSARWTRSLLFDAQTYRFTLRADDGVRLWIDGALVVDEWHMAAPAAFSREMALAAGWHAVRIEYYEASGDAYVQFKIDRVGSYPDWKAEYYANPRLSGNPNLVRNDRAVGFDWGGGAPANGLPADRFSARWMRTVAFDAGTYRFSLRVDDGVRFYIDGALIIDEWHDGSSRVFSREVALSAGAHTLVIECYEAAGGASIWFTVKPVEDITRGKGAYFANGNLAGYPQLIRNDDKVDFDWGRGSPNQLLPADHFSVRWTRSIELEAGEYRFDMTADDGVRFYVDGVLVLDQWHEAARKTYSINLTLPKGKHAFTVEYVEFGGDAVLQWSRTPLATATPTYTPTATATSTLTPTPTPTSTSTATPTTTLTATSTLTLTPTPSDESSVITYTPTPTTMP